MTLRELVDDAQAGSKQAEDELLSILRARFFTLAKRIVDDTLAEDLAQEACITVYERYREAEPQKNFEAWAFKVLRNKIGNHLQKESVRAAAFMKIRSTRGDSSSGREERNRILNDALLVCLSEIIKVNPRYARVLNLTQLGYSAEEICSRMGVSRNALYTALSRGRAMLLACLSKKGAM